jgi:tetratricopeptide (TPR) repeat protein
MSRTGSRVIAILLLLLLAILLPIALDGYTEIGNALKADAYTEKAEHYLNAARKLPWRADLYELAGHAYFHEGDYATAEVMYRRANERNALSPEGWAAWGDVRFLNDDANGAIEVWTQGLEQTDFLPGLYQRLSYAMETQGDFPRAVEYLQSYLARQPGDASAHYQLGLMLTLTNPSAASRELLTASQLDPRFDPPAQTLRATLNLAQLQESPSEQFVVIGSGLGLVEEWVFARHAFDSAVQANESNAEAWAWLGEADQHTGSDGSEALDRALELNPNSPIVRGLRGLYFERIGNSSQALAEYLAAASLDPQNPQRYFSLGYAYAMNGDLIRALETMEFATTLAPDDAQTWRALAEFCGQYGIHLNDIAIPAAQRAVALEPDNSASEDTLGWVWYLNGDMASAERHLHKALELDDQNASAHLHLGMVYLQTNDRARAFQELSLARDLGNEQASAILMQYFP